MTGARASRRVEIREMEIEDIADVFQLGNLLFHGPGFTTLYRTWDPYEVTTNFNQDPELCLVAEEADGEIVGFALGTTYEKGKGAWKYGLINWLGVHPDWQRQSVGKKLYVEMESCMKEQGVRMVLMDTASTNTHSIDFFKTMGFGKPQSQVWMSKTLKRSPGSNRRTPANGARSPEKS